jgi:hypothetical protein
MMPTISSITEKQIHTILVTMKITVILTLLKNKMGVI